jgi:hypothetical protein
MGADGKALRRAARPHGLEENFKLKRTISILAALSAALLPLAAISQVSPDSGSTVADQPERIFKYEVYGGYAYTSLNQVDGSRFGLQGVNVSVSRYWGRYFGLTAEGDDYTVAISTPVVVGSSITPSVSSVFVGPVLHANIYGKVGGFFHGLLGGEHTGGLNQTPNISFAGGLGGGLDYSLSPRLAIRASGDYIGASFSLTGNSAELGNSPHKSWDSRASIGVSYKF